MAGARFEDVSVEAGASRPTRTPKLAGLPNGASHLVLILMIAAVYYGAAQTGFLFAFATKQVTAIWPPTGLSLAALVLGGRRL